MTEEIKIMLSHPMSGKTKEEIDNQQEEMVNYLFDKYGEGQCVIIATVIENAENKSELECFSESIVCMTNANVLCMGKGWENSRECRLEHTIAKEYGLSIIYLDEQDQEIENRFYIAVEQLKKHYNYATQQMNKNIDNIFVHNSYQLLRDSIKDIAEELGVELE